MSTWDAKCVLKKGGRRGTLNVNKIDVRLVRWEGVGGIFKDIPFYFVACSREFRDDSCFRLQTRRWRDIYHRFFLGGGGRNLVKKNGRDK